MYWDDHHPLRAAYKRQYRSAIFYASEAERAIAEQTKQNVGEALGKRVFVDIAPLREFYLAEDYHQKWYLRRHKEVVAEEFAGYDARAFTDSTVAMRLNAHVHGFGSVAELRVELQSLGLSIPAQRWIERIVKQREGAGKACGI